MKKNYYVYYKPLCDSDFIKFENIGHFENTLRNDSIYYFFIGSKSMYFGVYYIFRVVSLGCYIGDLYVRKF